MKPRSILTCPSVWLLAPPSAEGGALGLIPQVRVLSRACLQRHL